MGRTKPKPPPMLARPLWRDRVVQGLFAVVVWWAVYLRVAQHYGLGGGIVAATCAAWAYVLVCACASYLLNMRGAGANRPGGPGGPGGSSGRWPGPS